MADFLDLWRDLTWLGRLFYAAAAVGSFGVIGCVLYVFILGLEAL